MIKNKLFKVAAVFACSFFLAFTGCQNVMDQNSASNSKEFGSITISGQNAAKYLNASTDINKANITVSGYGMTDITRNGVSVVNGANGENITISSIPVGKRVIKIQAYKDDEIVTGKVLYKVVNIVPGDNGTVAVTKETSIEGKAYSALLDSGVDIAGVSSITGISSITNAVLFDAASFAQAYKTDATVNAGSYLFGTGSVSVTCYTYEGKKVRVTDPYSGSEVTAGADGAAVTISNVLAGTWKVQVLDTDGSVLKTKAVTVTAGQASSVVMGTAPFDGIQIQVAKSLGYNQIHYWDCSDATNYPDTAWPGVVMDDSISDEYYIFNFDGCSSLKCLITKGSSGDKLCSSDITISAKGAYIITSSGASASTYIASEVVEPVLSASYSGGTVTVSTTQNVDSADITVSSGTHSESVTSFTNKNATVVVSGWGLAAGDVITVSGTAENEAGSGSINTTITVPADNSVRIYISADSAPTLWVHDAGENAISEKMLKETWPGNAMSAATDLNYNPGWFVKVIPEEYISGSTLNIHINSGSVINTNKTTTFWYDAAGIVGAAGEYYDEDPTTVPEPVLPTLEISPASGREIGTSASIKITANFGYDTPTVKRATINGTEHTLSEGVNTFPVSDITDEAGVAITVSAVLTNSVGTANLSAIYTTKVTAEDPFTWDNVNAYFVLTDRFANGDTTNDHSYYRKNGLTGDENVATFHGGDIKGLTDNLDYFDKLGVNAIWITAPYEQSHGWVSGKGHKFPHYAFHGYYTLDWTAMDANMGTVEELRTFVNACHSKGIRVIMDVVMNHVGYNNQEDMITYNHGGTSITEHGWLAKTGCPETEQGCALNHTNCYYANYTVDWTASLWDSKWWGPWIRSFGYEEGSEYGGSCGGLPDVKHEIKNSVGMAPVLVTKWNTDSSSIKSSYYNPSVAAADWNGYSGNYREDRELDPGTYQVIWLSAWVREVGIDGFRCDTAKHVQPERWGQLKVACQAALEAWRDDTTKSKLYNGVDTGAADWDENFWMTGECFGWTAIDGTNNDYYNTGKFDSMINFSFNGSQTSSTTSNYPSETTWSGYLSINSNPDYDDNGNRNNVLTYISSHDTALCRASNQYNVGTMLQLTPGGIQIYYGDESNRGQAYTGCGDSDMMTRGDMNLSEAKSSALTAHWGKVGTFRKYNPAVGAGTGTAYKRSYSGPAGESKVAIGIDGTTVDVSGLWSNGTTVYNWYDGTSATVSGGSVTFAGGSMTQPILVSDKNPASYGVTF